MGFSASGLVEPPSVLSVIGLLETPSSWRGFESSPSVTGLVRTLSFESVKTASSPLVGFSLSLDVIGFVVSPEPDPLSSGSLHRLHFLSELLMD